MPRKLRVYVASSWENRTLLTVFWDWLQTSTDVPLVLTSDWFIQPPVENLKQRARLDFGAIDESDLVIVVYPYAYGSSSEAGYALALDKHLIYFREPWADSDFLVEGMLSELDSTEKYATGQPLRVYVDNMSNLRVAISMVAHNTGGCDRDYTKALMTHINKMADKEWPLSRH